MLSPLFKRAVTLLAALLCTCCVIRETSVDPIEPYREPVATMELWGDVDFTPVERQWAIEATQKLKDQTRGFIDVRISWKLNYRNDGILQRSIYEDLLIKMDREAAPVKDWNEKHGCGDPAAVNHTCLLGLTTYYPTTDTHRIFIIYDQINRSYDYHTAFVQTVEHEILHALGLRHVEFDDKAVMAEVRSVSAPCLRQADIVELCRVWGCQPERVGFCS